MAACIIRAIWSEAPPAPAATTISTGLVGSHATAGTPASMIASVTAVLAKLFIYPPFANSVSLTQDLTCAFPTLQTSESSDSVAFGSRDAPLRRGRGLFAAFPQVRERRFDAVLPVWHVAHRQAHLDTAERSAKHEIV